jgi:hypothetical protein
MRMPSDAYYHLTDHRHGRRPLIEQHGIPRWVTAMVVLLLLLVVGGLAAGMASHSSGCQPVNHGGQQVCATYNGNDQVVFVPWPVWMNGGTYLGVSYGSGGSGSTFSRSYGYTDGSDTGGDTYGTGDSSGGGSSGGDAGTSDAGFSGGGD